MILFLYLQYKPVYLSVWLVAFSKKKKKARFHPGTLSSLHLVYHMSPCVSTIH